MTQGTEPIVPNTPEQQKGDYEPSNSNTDVSSLASHSSGVGNSNEHDEFIAPDHGDECWKVGAESFTRKEVAHLLYTQRAMIANDLKTYCGNHLTNEIFDIINNPRKPIY